MTHTFRLVFLMLVCITGLMMLANIREQYTTQDYENDISVNQNSNQLIFKSGDGQVTIDLRTGVVEYYNTSLDEASLNFWNAAMNTFPYARRMIIQDYLAQKRRNSHGAE